MNLGKDGNLRQRTSSKRHWPLHDSDINSTLICLEINSLTEFWLKLYACMNSVYQAFIIHPHKIRMPGNKANMMQVPFNTKPKEDVI